MKMENTDRCLSDSRRNAILQTVLVNMEEGRRGAPESYTPEEKEYYIELEKNILTDLAAGRFPNYSIAASDDW